MAPYAEPKRNERELNSAMDAKLRLIWVGSKLNWAGGPGRVVSQGAEALAERGHEVHIIGRVPGDDPGDIPGVTVHRWPMWQLKLRQIPPLVRLIRQVQPHIVHFHSAIPHGEVILATHGLRRLRADAPKVFLSPYTSNRSHYPKRRARLGLRVADRLIVSTHWSRDRAIAAGANAETTQVIPTGVRPAEVPLRDERDNVIVMIGRFVPIKGAHIIIDAFSRIAAEHPDWKLVVGGLGRDEAALRKQAAESAYTDRIELPGGIYGAEKADLLSRAAIGVVPSLAENFPGILQEFQAYGLACIASDVGGLPDAAIDGAARLVPPNDPAALARTLDEWIRDPITRTQFRRQALAFATQLSWPNIAERFETAYRSAL